MKRILNFFAALAIIAAAQVGTASAQRSNYTEDDIVIMRSQKDVCYNVMKLLEEKNVDSALYFFHHKDKATKAKLTEIANAIQQHKAKYTLEISEDAPDDKENAYYCKYTTDEGVTVKYRIDFIFGRNDKEYKVSRIVQPANKPAPKPKNKGR